MWEEIRKKRAQQRRDVQHKENDANLSVALRVAYLHAATVFASVLASTSCLTSRPPGRIDSKRQQSLPFCAAAHTGVELIAARVATCRDGTQRHGDCQQSRVRVHSGAKLHSLEAAVNRRSPLQVQNCDLRLFLLMLGSLATRAGGIYKPLGLFTCPSPDALPPPKSYHTYDSKRCAQSLTFRRRSLLKYDMRIC